VKIRPPAVFSFCALVFFCVFVYLAQDWRMQARLYPWAIGIPMLILAIVQVILDLKGVKAKPSDDGAPSTPMDFQFTKDVDPVERSRGRIGDDCVADADVARTAVRIDVAAEQAGAALEFAGDGRRQVPVPDRLVQVIGFLHEFDRERRRLCDAERRDQIAVAVDAVDGRVSPCGVNRKS